MILVTGALAACGHALRRAAGAALRRRLQRGPGKLELTIRLTRIMFPFLMLVSVAAVLMGMLNALHRFFHSSAVAGHVQRGHDRLRACCWSRWRRSWECRHHA